MATIERPVQKRLTRQWTQRPPQEGSGATATIETAAENGDTEATAFTAASTEASAKARPPRGSNETLPPSEAATKTGTGSQTLGNPSFVAQRREAVSGFESFAARHSVDSLVRSPCTSCWRQPTPDNHDNEDDRGDKRPFPHSVPPFRYVGRPT